MRIAKDGTWIHEGKPIRRPAMVKLFASILKLENGDHFLVTPVEKIGIQVEDCPFLITEMEVSGAGKDQIIEFTTSTDERFKVDGDHQIAFSAEESSSEPHPTVHVRGGLLGLISRPVFYRLVELIDEIDCETGSELGVWSGGEFFKLT